MRWVAGSDPHSHLIKLFHVPGSDLTTGVTQTVVCAILAVVMVHIKEPLMLIEKSSPCTGCSGFLLSLSFSRFAICPTLYNRKIKCVKLAIKTNNLLPFFPPIYFIIDTRERDKCFI